jgi:hypothetical protein
MKAATSILFLLIILSSCIQKPDCSDLKTGLFKIETQNGKTILVSRTETQSIESIPSSNMKMTNTLEWTGDCTFTINYESGDKPSSPSANMPVDCEIIEVGEGYHIVRARIRGSEIEADYRMENQ